MTSIRKSPHRTRISTNAPRLKSSRARHLKAVAITFVLALSGLAALALGLYAWTLPPTPEMHLSTGRRVELTSSPIFSSGSTVFVSAPDADRPVESWDCMLTRATGSVQLTTRPGADTGRRAQQGVELIGIIDIGPTKANDSMVCSWLHPESTQVWVMPTQAGAIRAIPLALVVAGIGLLGGAMVASPRTRGITVFGR